MGTNVIVARYLMGSLLRIRNYIKLNMLRYAVNVMLGIAIDVSGLIAKKLLK